MLAIAVPWLWFPLRELGGPLDLVAVGLPLIGVAAIIVGAVAALLAGRAWPLIAAASALMVCAVAVLAPRFPRRIAPPATAIRVAMANVWEGNPTPEAVPEALVDRGADVLVAVEMPSDEFYRAMTASAATDGLDSAVRRGWQAAWSRFPLDELDELGLGSWRVMRVSVDVPDSPFVLYIVHGLNPLRDTSFEDQRLFVEDLLAAIGSEQRPVVVTGDFNMSDRVVSYRVMDAALTDAMRAETPGRTTYVSGLWSTVLLRIDHVFVDPAWCAADPGTFTVTGSDHRGVEVAVGPCP